MSDVNKVFNSPCPRTGADVAAAQCAEECPVSVVYLHWRPDPAWAPATLPPSHVTRDTWHTPRVTRSSHLEYPACDVMSPEAKTLTLQLFLFVNGCKISTVLPPCHMSECMEHVCISCYQLLILLWLLPSVTQRRGCNEITTATLPHSLNIHSYTTCQLYPLQLIHHDHCTQCSHRM